MSAAETYNLLDVPESPDDGTRFALAKSRGGHNVGSPGDVAVGSFGSLFAEVLEPAAVALTVPPVTLSLRGWVVDANGVEHEVPRGSISGSPTLASRRPGKMGKCKLTGPKLLDSFFLGQEAFEWATDAEVWRAGFVFVKHYKLRGRELRQLSDWISVALALRIGLRADVAHLPNLGDE